MANVFMVSEHARIGAIVDFGKQKVAFEKYLGKLALNTAHFIEELPEGALFRHSTNVTLQEAASAFVEKRVPRWAKQGIYP